MDNERKIMIIKRDKMKREGLMQWSPHLRKKVIPFVYRNLGVKHIPYSAFETRYKFALWVKENYGFGYFNVFIWRPGYYKKRSVKRLRPYRIATIEIQENKTNFIDLTRISRFKWFEPEKISKKQERADKVM